MKQKIIYIVAIVYIIVSGFIYSRHRMSPISQLKSASIETTADSHLEVVETTTETSASETDATETRQLEGEAEVGDGKVNINTATEDELTTLKGVGPSKAQKIIEYRNTYGKFEKIEDIMNVSGIKEGSYNKIKDYIKVE